MTDETNRIAGAIFDYFCCWSSAACTMASYSRLSFRERQLFEVELEATVRRLERVSKDA